MAVILIRHGRVEKTQGLPLSPDGQSFAGGLSGAFSARHIRKLMSTADGHCLATLRPLSDALGINIDTFSSVTEVSSAIRQGDWSINDIVILFRMANADAIFRAVGLVGQGPSSSDEAYGNMWFVDVESRKVKLVATGY
ncbi:MAG TPA: hypothetical protein ENK23_03095 [Sorangium sp.]|nr:hypothetical protein [Sorangium sp.]